MSKNRVLFCFGLFGSSDTRSPGLTQGFENKAAHEREWFSVKTANAHKTRQCVKGSGFCVPVRGIMETALSWHSLGDKASSYPVRGIKTNKSSEILLLPFGAI